MLRPGYRTNFSQAYVALSRATTLDGLHLLDFHFGVVRAHETVKDFYAKLEVRGMVPFGTVFLMYQSFFFFLSPSIHPLVTWASD